MSRQSGQRKLQKAEFYLFVLPLLGPLLVWGLLRLKSLAPPPAPSPPPPRRVIVATALPTPTPAPKLIRKFDLEKLYQLNNITASAVSANSRFMAIATGHGPKHTIKVFDVEHQKLVRSWRLFPKQPAYDTYSTTMPGEFRLSSDGKILVLKSERLDTQAPKERFVSRTMRMNFECWQVSTARVVSEIEPPSVSLGTTQPYSDVAISPNHKFLAAGVMSGKEVIVWSVANGKELRVIPPVTKRFQGAKSAIFFQNSPAIAFSPDSRMLAIAWRDNIIHLCDVRTGRHLRTLGHHCGGDFDPNCSVAHISFSPNSQLLQSVCTEHGMRLWTLKKGIAAPSNANIWGGVFSPNSNLLAYTTGGKYYPSGVEVWNLKTDVIQAFPITDSKVYMLGFSQDNKSIHFANGHTMVYWALR